MPSSIAQDNQKDLQEILTALNTFPENVVHSEALATAIPVQKGKYDEHRLLLDFLEMRKQISLTPDPPKKYWLTADGLSFVANGSFEKRLFDLVPIGPEGIVLRELTQKRVEAVPEIKEQGLKICLNRKYLRQTGKGDKALIFRNVEVDHVVREDEKLINNLRRLDTVSSYDVSYFLPIFFSKILSFSRHIV